MTTITTDGRALADAATLARKLTDAARRVATLTIADGRAELVVGDGTTGVVEVIGHGSADPATRVAIAVDVDQLRTMRRVGEVTIRDAGGVWTMTAVGTAEGVTSSVTSTLLDLVGEVPTWPTFPGVVDPLAVMVRGDEAAEVADALRSVATASAHGADARDVLRHVVLRDGEVAATDTYRLNVATIPVEGPGEALVPASWLAAIPRRGVDRLELLAEGGDGAAAELTYRVMTRGRTRRVAIVGRVSPGPFPNYRGLMPDTLDGAATMVVRSSLGDVVKPLGDHRTPVVVTLGDADDVITLTADDGRTASYGTATTGTVTVAANPAYLADLVDHVGDGATLYLRDGLRAMIAEGEGRTTLLMPMRVTS